MNNSRTISWLLNDPIGLLSPIIVLFKMFFQTLCKNKVDWDEPLEPILFQEWKVLADSLKKVESVSVNRYYLGNNSLSEIIDVQLRGFADASERAYGDVVFV